MKRCLRCGKVARGDVIACLDCSGSSFATATPLFGIGEKDNGFMFPVDVYAERGEYVTDTWLGLVPYTGDVFQDEATAKRAADAINVPLGRGPVWPEAAKP